MDTAKKKLKVNISEIADAMQSTFDGDLHYYLDSETGKVILIQDEVISAVEGNDQERIDGLPDWEKEVVVDAKKIVSDKDHRYIAISALESWESFKHMEAFVDTVQDDALHEKLSIALDGKGAFGRFKRVLEAHPPQKERWFRFKEERMAEEVERFLFSVDIEPLETTTT